MSPSRLLLLSILSIISSVALAQAIRGEVVDMEDRRPIPGVNIRNIYTSLDINSGETGAFLIAATSGQLLEFRKQGYKTVRVRIPQGFIPPYFEIILKKGISDLKITEPAPGALSYHDDSIRFHEMYKHELEFPRLSAFESIAHPFSALSARNREIWRFQDEYEEFEREKYVDKTFNEAVVTRFTSLSGDSLKYYMRRYRPTYEQLRNMNEYAFYNFIKTSVQHYRSIQTPRSSH